MNKMAASMVYVFSLAAFCYFPSVLTLPFHNMDAYFENYELPELPYSYDALEPYIDEATLRVHHAGHHAAYTKKMNAALHQWRDDPDTDQEGLASKSIIEILARIDEIPDRYRNAIRNNGGGFVNHNLYWSVMMPGGGETERGLEPQLQNDFENDFGGLTEFRQNFSREAAKLFGSGYVWLSRRSGDGQLVVTTTANQDSPLSQGLRPILVLDVWEHAYYLKHQNRRLEHVSDWWKLVNWSAVHELDIWWQKRYHDEL